jgi:hypothetical protein
MRKARVPKRAKSTGAPAARAWRLIGEPHGLSPGFADAARSLARMKSPFVAARRLAALGLGLAAAWAPAQNPTQDSIRNPIQYIDSTQRPGDAAAPGSVGGPQNDRPIDLDKVRDPATRERLRRLIEERGLASRRKPIVQYKSEPWLGPDGEQLAGIVNDRALTLSQLRERARLILNLAPPLNDSKLEDDRRAAYEDQVLESWIENVAIAEYAKSKRIAVAATEVDRVLEQLTKPLPNAGARQDQGIDPSRFIGLREDELRQEIRDGLMTDKAVRRGIRELFDDRKLRVIYDQNPRKFLLPTRVRAWQVYCPTITFGHGQDKAVIDHLKTLGKKLARAKAPADYAVLQREIGTRRDLLEKAKIMSQAQAAGAGNVAGDLDPSERAVISDMGWVSADDLLPQELHQALFDTKPGRVSDVFKSTDPQGLRIGYQVVKVIEREAGEKGSFDLAKPRIENSLYDQVKETIYEQVKGQYKVYSNSSGLLKRQRIQATVAANVAGSTTLRPAAAPAPAASAAAAGNAGASLLSNPPSVEEVLRRKAEIDVLERKAQVQKQP